ncbi:MAG: hypothetical protein KY455_05340 [Euryarchaeota archaeon]|nr:hypothetical protein [Euryarchaeota archaeon]
METVDTLIIVFAVIAVVGSAAGAFLYDPPASPKDFVVTFTEEEHDVASEESGSVSGSTISDTVDVPVPMPNVTALELTVTMSPSNSPPVRANPANAVIIVKDPAGSEVGRKTITWASTESGAKSVDFDIAQQYLAGLPDSVDTRNLTAEEAETWAAGEFTNRTATGIWRVTVQISNPGTVPNEETFAISVSGTATHYHGQARLETGPISGAA